METEDDIKRRIESYGIELIERRNYRKKNGHPSNALFPSDSTDTPKFWDNECRIEGLLNRIQELRVVLGLEKPQLIEGDTTDPNKRNSKKRVPIKEKGE